MVTRLLPEFLSSDSYNEFLANKYLCGLKTLPEFDIHVTANALWCII